MLSELDRPVTEYFFEPWQRAVKMRRLSAEQFVQVMGDMGTADEKDAASQVRVMSRICAMGIVDPAATAEEWAGGTTVDTLMHLGNQVLRNHSTEAIAAAKKN
jgi:hypothetical protein